MDIKIVKAFQLDSRLYTEGEIKGKDRFTGEDIPDIRIADDAPDALQFELAERVAFGFASLMDEPSKKMAPMLAAFKKYEAEGGAVPKLSDFTEKKKAEAPKA